MTARMWRASSRCSSCAAAAAAADLSSALSSLYLASGCVRRVARAAWQSQVGARLHRASALDRRRVRAPQVVGAERLLLLRLEAAAELHLAGGAKAPARLRRTDGRRRRAATSAAAWRGGGPYRRRPHAIPASVHAAAQRRAQLCAARRRTRFAPPMAKAWELGTAVRRTSAIGRAEKSSRVMRWHRMPCWQPQRQLARAAVQSHRHPPSGRDERDTASVAACRHFRARSPSSDRSSHLAAVACNPRVALHGCCCARRPPAPAGVKGLAAAPAGVKGLAAARRQSRSHHRRRERPWQRMCHGAGATRRQVRTAAADVPRVATLVRSRRRRR